MKLINHFIKIGKEETFYVRSLSKDIENLIKIAKQQGLSITSLSRKLNVAQNIPYLWKKQGIPISKLNKLNHVFKKVIGKPLTKTEFTFGLEKSSHTIKIPELNNELAYLIGYLTGDGTLSHDGRVEFDDASKEYLENITFLIEKLFGLKKFELKKDKIFECYCLRFNCKILQLFFNKIFEIPIGKKKNKLHIPKIIRESQFIADYISGLFDAEGSIYYTPTQGYQITIGQRDKTFLEEIGNIINSLGISVNNITSDRLLITKKENFLKLISLLNLKHPDKIYRIKLALDGKSTVKNIRLSPVKLKILEKIDQFRTSKELAQQFNIKRRTMWIHLRELEKMNLIKGERSNSHKEVIWKK